MRNQNSHDNAENGARSSGLAAPEAQAVAHLRDALERGVEWRVALLQAISLWTAPQEIYNGARLVYLIASEAFDWLALANRLAAEARDLIPDGELEDLLFTGRFPSEVDETDFKDILGAEKYSAYLNFFYGVEVEMALQRAVESEVEKRAYAGGHQYMTDHTDAAFQSIYGMGRARLLAAHRESLSRPNRPLASMTEIKEFTYWLFKRRLRVSDKARIASDTRKGIAALDAAIRLPEEVEALAV